MQGDVFMSEKQSAILGWIGTLLSVIMYVSYVPQIINNLHGMKGTPIQPLAAAVNCTIWVIYSLTKKNRDYPVAAANAPGIIFGLIAAIIAVI
jgi:integral membrane protein